MALSFDLLTALTISGILAILSIYIIVVYKKGWLKKESKAEQAYYLCPNHKCKRVFKKPVWLTDLSRTPAESYQACPHCGISIQTTTSPSSLASPMSEATLKPSHPSPEIRNLQDRPHLIKPEARADKAEISRERSESSFQTGTSSPPPKPEAPSESKPIFRFPQIRKDTPQKPSEQLGKSVEKSSPESPKKCSHFFGYVRTLPKNTPIPDECLWCPSIVDCLTHESKVEAEA